MHERYNIHANSAMLYKVVVKRAYVRTASNSSTALIRAA